MKLFQKLKNRRGISLAEVLVVVMIMTIMLGIAMPNILAESQSIKLATMDGYARSVAVAVQSKLYGMKDAGTAADSSYSNLNAAAQNVEITTDEGNKSVKYITNFGENGAKGKLLLSGAITDVELLQNGKIVVIYDPKTADVLEVYYAESVFNISALFPTATEAFLQEHMIGLYRGYGAPAPERTIGLPDFAITWGDDDEKYLELTMKNSPDPELLNRPLGLEVYALLPTEDPAKYDSLLIYAEGLIADEYTADSVKVDPRSTASQTIAPETAYQLTLQKIQQNEGKLRFVIDSMVIPSVDYDNVKVKQMLYRNTSPQYVTVADKVLYPRESLDNWLNKRFNPYISFGIDADLYDVSPELALKLDDDTKKVTDYVAPNQKMELQVKLYVLKENDHGGYETQTTKDGFCSYYVEDDNYASVTVTSQPANPYFYSSSSKDESEIALASVRDLKNLKYIFETDNNVTRAQLYHDIDVQQFYEKLVNVRYALIDKNPSVRSDWSVAANSDTLYIAQIPYADGKGDGREGFTISGTKTDISGKKTGRYAIKNVQTGGADWARGGFIEYAKNITVENLDIVNPKIWKISYKADFIKTDKKGKITDINVEWNNSVSGGLFGVAENCTFTNVHCYNDGAQNFKQEPFNAESYKPEEWVPSVMATRYISGSVAGGLVGIAVGTKGGTTKFTNCSASTQINSYYYGAMAQCVYAGGLVGIAMGNVTIENSYAACQLAGYYSGGLVGAVADVPFTYHVNLRGNYWLDGTFIQSWWEAEYTSPLNGTLTIENSFSAGHIQRQTMVGGGLIAQTNGATVVGEGVGPIAQTNGATVEVKNCYSASVWEILPPIAYGTFEGDTSNYYLVQDEINVPITLNTEARFMRTAGDVFSLNNQNSGIAVTADQLESELTGWVNVTRTLQWRNKDNSGVPTFLLPTDAEPGLDGVRSDVYPFPMPSGNTEFWGDWNDNSATNIESLFAASFGGFYCVYFKRTDDGYQRFIDAAAVHELEFEFSGTTAKLSRWDITIKNSVTNPEDIWWASQKADDTPLAETAFGTGVAGMTKVTVDDTTVTFTGAPYYNSKYSPTNGYANIDRIGGANEGESRYLNWDYYGWYVSNGLFRSGYLTQSGSDGALSNADANFTVEENAFKSAVGYGDFVFDTNDAELVYDGYFHVQEVE